MIDIEFTSEKHDHIIVRDVDWHTADGEIVVDDISAINKHDPDGPRVNDDLGDDVINDLREEAEAEVESQVIDHLGELEFERRKMQ